MKIKAAALFIFLALLTSCAREKAGQVNDNTPNDVEPPVGETMSIDDISGISEYYLELSEAAFQNTFEKTADLSDGEILAYVLAHPTEAFRNDWYLESETKQVKIPEAEVQDRVKKYFAIEGFVPKENLSYYDKQNKVYLVEPMGITENLRVKPISGKDLGEQVEIVVETYQGDETKLLQTSTYVLGKNENIGFHFISLKRAR
jgi:hypothetical protein